MKNVGRALAILALGSWGAANGATPESAGSLATGVQPSPAPQLSGLPDDEDPDPEGQGAREKPEHEGEAPEAGAEAGSPQAPCDPKADICLIADKQGRENGRLWGRGFADLRVGDLEVQADSIDVSPADQGQVSSRTLVAEGNVVLLRKEERLMGQKMTLDLGTGKGTLDNVVGYVEPGVYFTAKRVERLDPTTFRIQTGHFTSCCQSKPSWSFDAARATLKVGKRITADRVRFNLGVPVVGTQVPALYIPYLVYPINEEQRSTGLLFPRVNRVSGRGMDLRAGFFWAMGRSVDQTFFAEYRHKLAPALGHELHYALESPSWGSFVTHLFLPQAANAPQVPGYPPPSHKWDYTLNWNAVQRLPGGFGVTLRANTTAAQDLTEPAGRLFDPTREASLAVQRAFGRQQLLISAKSVQTISGDRTEATDPTNSSLPKIQLSQPAHSIGLAGVLFQYSAEAARLSTRKIRKEGPRTDEWARFDFGPALSRPVTWDFLSLTPKMQLRYTHYSATLDQDAQGNVRPNQPLTGGALARRYAEASVEMQGPRFAKVFGSPSAAISDKLKHVIGPELRWTRRRTVGATSTIPRFDNTDLPAEAHEVRYGLVNRLWARRATPGGKPMAFELFSWRVFQTYYLAPPQNGSDPDFQTRYPDPKTERTWRSPIKSQTTFSPIRNWAFDWAEEYDTRTKAVTYRSVGARLAGPLGSLSGTWSRNPEVKSLQGDRVSPADETVVGNGRLKVARDRLTLDFSLDYSLKQKLLIDRWIQLRLGGQCLALILSLRRTQSRGSTAVSTFGFSFELANLGSVGMGPIGPIGAGSRAGGAR